VLVLLSRRDQIYSEALNGFKQIRKFKERTIVISDYADVDVIRLLREDRPTVVLAVGDTALSIARKGRSVPIVSLMALSLNRGGAFPFITGVELFVKPENVIPVLQGIKAKRVGVLYDPEKSGAYIRKAQAVAAHNGVQLIAREVHSVKGVINELTQLKGNVDSIWMIPDSTAVNKRTVEAFYLFSLGQQVPIITFDRMHLGAGAALAVEPDRTEMGRQAGELVAAMLDGSTDSSFYTPVSPRKFIIKTNPNVFRLLNLNPNAVERFSTSRE
jgi:putative ABC transport system substrate-binding protein